MSNAIRIALILVAVAAIILMLSPIVTELSSTIDTIISHLSGFISQLSSYLSFGRRLLNLLIGVPVLVQICLYFTISLPITYYFVSIGAKVFKKVVG